MPDKPLLFLSFANDQDAHLPLLKQERRLIRSHFLELQSRQLIDLYYEPEASTADLFSAINEFADRIAIFHYGGHADSTHLRLDDQHAHAAGLAGILGALPKLQLVFLNGCSTREQVEQLLKAGAPLVIATRTPVQDQMAMDFAGRFYESLAKRNSISRAFSMAAGFVEMKYGKKVAEAQVDYRSLAWDQLAASDAPLPWGLYQNEQAREALLWKVPKAPKMLDARTSAVLMSMALHRENIHEEIRDRRGEPIDEREFPEVIIKNFPWPIGAQLRILHTEELFDAGEARLRQLVSTYVISMKLICWLIWAQLRQEKRLQPELPLADLSPLLQMNRRQYMQCDWLAALRQLIGFCEAQDIRLFARETQDLFEQEEAFVQACEYLQQMRDVLGNARPEIDDPVEACMQAEASLAAVHVAMAFLARYRMKTVKNIDIINPGYKPVAFSHAVGELNTYVVRQDREEILPTFTESDSILLIDENEAARLNLCPFLVDKNAYIKKPVPHVFIYAFQEEGAHCYLAVNHSLYKTLKDTADQLHSEEEGLEEIQEHWENLLLDIEA